VETIELSAAREALRTRGPLVHCLTNTVVQTLTANALLAVGAAPAMVDAPEEAGEFAAVASAVLVNVGTVHARTAEAMRLAARSAAAAGVPWVLDPVAVGVLALAGSGAGGRGVDSTAGTDEAAAAAAALAGRTGGVVAVSGPVDLITDGDRTVRVGGGSALLTRTTGAGCALGALVAAYVAVTDDPLVGAVAAHAHVALAAEIAADLADGPGTFAAQWLDALDALDGDALTRADLRDAG
jgi:hydroxyethylthiazole kinase-like sugar kinase family protein